MRQVFESVSTKMLAFVLCLSLVMTSLAITAKATETSTDVIIPTAETVTAGNRNTNGVTDTVISFQGSGGYATSSSNTGIWNLFQSDYSDVTSALIFTDLVTNEAMILNFAEPIDVSKSNVMTINLVVGRVTGDDTITTYAYASGESNLAISNARDTFVTEGNRNKKQTWTLDLTKYADEDGYVRNLTFRYESTLESNYYFGAFRLSYENGVIIPTADTVTVGEASTNGVTDTNIAFRPLNKYATSGGEYNLFSAYTDITSVLIVTDIKADNAVVLKFNNPIDVSKYNQMTMNMVVGKYTGTDTVTTYTYASGESDLATSNAKDTFVTAGNQNKKQTWTLDLRKYADENGYVNNLTFRYDSTLTSNYYFGAFRLSNYKELTFSNWGIVDETYTESKVYSLVDTNIASLDGYAFEGVFDFKGATNDAAYIRIGGGGRTNHYVAFQMGAYSATQLRFTNHYNVDGQPTVTPSGWSNSGKYAIRLTFDETATDTWAVGIWVNGVFQTSLSLTETPLGTELLFAGTMAIEDVDRSDILLNVEEDVYQVEKVGVRIDGTSYETGDVFNTVGVHYVSYTEYGQFISRKLVAYKLGDTNVDGTVNIIDLVRMKHQLKMHDPIMPDEAAKMSSNLDTHNSVTDADAQLLCELLLQDTQSQLHYGLGEVSKTLGGGSEVSYASNAFLAEAAGAFGVDTYRIWLPCIAQARSDGNGGYTVTLNQTKLDTLKELVARLKLQGVEQILICPTSHLMMHDYPTYIASDGKAYSAEQIEADTSNVIAEQYHDYYAVPDPSSESEQYADFLEIQQEYFYQLATAIPEITHFETINEPEGGTGSVRRVGAKCSVDGWTKPEAYTVAEVAKICMDYNYAVTAGVSEANTGAKVLAPALTATEAGPELLNAFYAYIAEQEDTNANHYFEILNWHPYIFYTSETGSFYSNATDWDNWHDNWVNWQNAMYQIAVDAGDDNTPVWFTEMGVTDCGTHSASHTTGGEITETMTAERLAKMFELIESNLLFVDTVVAFRITDTTLESEETAYPVSYEGNFGMFEYFANESSGETCLKEIAKTFYQIVNYGSTNYTPLTTFLNKYYSIYEDTYVLDQSEDFNSFGVVSGIFASNHSDLTITSASGYDYLLTPTLSVVADENEGNAIAFDFGEGSSSTDVPRGKICFNFGAVEAGTYKITFDVSDTALDDIGYLKYLWTTVTTKTNPNDWNSGKLLSATLIKESKSDTVSASERELTFTLDQDQENVSLWFQIQGNDTSTETTKQSNGSFRVIFDNVTLTKVVE